jgi:hypothetical protein
VPSELEAPDPTPYTRPVLPEDFAPLGQPAIDPEAVTLDPEAIIEEPGEPEFLPILLPRAPRPFLTDVVVSNTDSNLTNTDIETDAETSIAVNPRNPDEIVITAFSNLITGGWGAGEPAAPLWSSMDGGRTWTKAFTILVPPGAPVSRSCGPCDQTIDYGRENQLSETFMPNLIDIYSGTTMDPTMPDFNWFEDRPGMAQRTNHLATRFADQPWLLVNRDPIVASQDNVYVAYSDLSGGPDMRVAVAQGTNPPNFTIDHPSGSSTVLDDVQPGHRLAVDRTTGFIYSLWQQPVGSGADGSKHINYMLNRSTDGGQTWILNGQQGGIMVAEADSDQLGPMSSNRKFGTVNALLGGVLHAAVDPRTGALWYAYGSRDPATGNNRLAMRVIVREGADRVQIREEFFVTGQVQAALPAVAVTDDGTVGVFYYTFDGFGPPPPTVVLASPLPVFTAHLYLQRQVPVTAEPPQLKLSHLKDHRSSTSACYLSCLWPGTTACPGSESSGTTCR